MILGVHTMSGYTAWQWWVVKDRGKIYAPGFPVINRGLQIEHVDAADHVVNFAKAKIGHVLADLFGNEEKEIDDVFGLAGEFLAELWILRRDPDGASIQMALAKHDAAHCN